VKEKVSLETAEIDSSWVVEEDSWGRFTIELIENVDEEGCK
jgi:hypothetical protein